MNYSDDQKTPKKIVAGLATDAWVSIAKGGALAALAGAAVGLTNWSAGLDLTTTEGVTAAAIVSVLLNLVRKYVAA